MRLRDLQESSQGLREGLTDEASFFKDSLLVVRTTTTQTVRLMWREKQREPCRAAAEGDD
jgi:hypothetical protein